MWYVIPLELWNKLDKRLAKRSLMYTRQQINDAYQLSVVVYHSSTTCYVEKPTEIPEGCTLKCWPDKYYLADKMIARRNNVGTPPPWELSYDDGGYPTSWRSWWVLKDRMCPRIVDGMVDYFPSIQHAMENRSEQTTMGKFLTMLWKQSEELWDNYLNEYGYYLNEELMAALTAPIKVQTKDDVQFFSTPEDIERVYRNGVDSCMSKDVSAYSTGGIHPVRTYGAGDLAVACLEKTRQPGRYSQRAMVWPVKKVYSRIYGTGKLEKFLKELGYTEGKFHGARLLKIQHPTSEKHYIMPYVDWHDVIVDAGKFLKIWYKTKPHPIIPELEINSRPVAKTRFPCCNGTAGVQVAIGPKPKPEKCQLCNTRKRKYNSTICHQCARTHTTCGECGTWIKRKDLRGLITRDRVKILADARHVTLLQNADATYCMSDACQNRMHDTIDVMKRNYPNEPNYHYFVIPSVNDLEARKKKHVESQDAPVDAPVQAADGIENRA